MYHKEGFTQICPRALLYSRPFLSFSFPTHKVLLIQDVDSLSCMDLFPTPPLQLLTLCLSITAIHSCARTTRIFAPSAHPDSTIMSGSIRSGDLITVRSIPI